MTNTPPNADGTAFTIHLGSDGFLPFMQNLYLGASAEDAARAAGCTVTPVHGYEIDDAEIGDAPRDMAGRERMEYAGQRLDELADEPSLVGHVAPAAGMIVGVTKCIADQLTSSRNAWKKLGIKTHRQAELVQNALYELVGLVAMGEVEGLEAIAERLNGPDEA